MGRDLDAFFEDWKSRAAEQSLLETARRFGAALKRSGQEWVGPCPVCGGKDRFSVNPSKRVWNCRGFGGGHDAIGLVMHIGSLDFLGACEELTGEAPPKGKRRDLTDEEKAAIEHRKADAKKKAERQRLEEEMNERERIEAARRIWKETVSLAGTLAETYLRSRGLEMDKYPASLRFHKGLRHAESGKTFPCLVAGLQAVDDSFAGVWRIYLKPDGTGKAPVVNAKMGLGVAAGAAVRLAPAAEHTGTCEGLETGLGVTLLERGRIPIWPALSTSGLINIQFPTIVSRVSIFADGDRPKQDKNGRILPPPGGKAAQTLLDRLNREGVESAIQVPEPGMNGGRDFLDCWLAVKRLRDEMPEINL